MFKNDYYLIKVKTKLLPDKGKDKAVYRADDRPKNICLKMTFT